MLKVPAIKVTKVIGFTDDQIEELKLAAKKEISFTVSFRKRKQKYAAGTFNISPYRADKWTEEQFQEIEAFMVKHKLTTIGLSIYDEKKISNYKLYNIGVNTVYSILEYEETETITEQPEKDEIRSKLDQVKAEVSYTYDLFVRASASRSGNILKELLDLRKQEKELKLQLRT